MIEKINEFLKFKYISFDIFDTLIYRDVINPTEVFDIVEKKYNKQNENKINDFKNLRIRSQIEATKLLTEKEEVTLNEIYEQLKKYYDENICSNLKKIEIETEINICVPNKKIQEIYNELLRKKKNIIITSDMYLDTNTIEEILKKCGYKDYKKLYLSSTIQKRKSSGSLFKFILNNLNIKGKDLIHIGDNLVSDILMAKLNGIHTKQIINKSSNLFYNKKIDKENEVIYKNLEKFISNHYHNNNSYYYNMGYECFGTILYGYSEWLKNNVDNKKIFFLSRDGYLMKQAFEIIGSEKNNSYFYASRRALIIPTLWMDDTLKNMLDKLYIRDYIKIDNLFRKLGIETKKYEKIINKFGFKLEDKIDYNQVFKNKKFMALFNEMKPIIHENSKKEYELLLKYLKQENFNENSIIADIGWNGNMQMALSNIMKSINKDSKIAGYYFGILPESKNIGKINMKGYLFDEKNNYDIYICLKVINSIFESMFLAPHGSVKKYELNNKKVKPVLLNYEYEDSVEKKAYHEIQEGALQFMRDFNNSDLKYLININPRLSFYNMKKFAYYPTNRDIEKFGDFKFLEDDIIYLAKPNKISFYIMHPKIFFKDLYLSGWIIGFMKRLTKISIFYTVIYKFYIKLYLKKRNVR